MTSATKPTMNGFDMLGEHQYASYVYLLGLYLGDGHIVHQPRTFRLQIYFNENTPEIIEACAEAVQVVVPHRRVGHVRHGQHCRTVNSYFGGWPELFPQHGAGRKHTRRIELTPWQRGLVRCYPDRFVNGCIHSDGCRHRRIVKGKNYPAYSFKNHSEDILRLFVWACELVGVRPRQSNSTTISIARRPDVARLDALMGWSAPAPQP